MKREFEKMKHMQMASEKVKQDQQALINLQAKKIENLKKRVNASQRNSQLGFHSAEKASNKRRSQSPGKISQDFLTYGDYMRSINENKRGSIYRAEVRQDPNRDLYKESRLND